MHNKINFLKILEYTDSEMILPRFIKGGYVNNTNLTLNILSEKIIVTMTTLKIVPKNEEKYHYVMINFFINEEDVKELEENNIITEYSNIIPKKGYDKYIIIDIPPCVGLNNLTENLFKAHLKKSMVFIDSFNDCILNNLIESEIYNPNINLMLNNFYKFIIQYYDEDLLFNGYNQYFLFDKGIPDEN